MSRSLADREPLRLKEHARLRERLRALAGENRRYGYRRLHELLEREGWRVQPDNQDETSATIWMRAGRLARNGERA